MIKSVGIYKNIKNLEEFEPFFIKNIIPLALKMPGVIKMNFTVLHESTDEQPEGLNDIDVICETYFESIDAFAKIISAKENMDLIEDLISKFSSGKKEIGVFLAKEKTFYAPRFFPQRPTGENIVEVVDLEDN